MDDLQAAAIGLAVAVAGGVPTIWATRRWGTRRGRVQIELNTTSLLLMSGAFKSDIEVRVGDQALRNPSLFTIVIRNIGPRDLASSQFDNGKPITARVPGRVVAARWMSSGVSPKAVSGDESSEISWSPALLPQKSHWTLHVLVDLYEERMVEFVTPLIDFDIAYTSGTTTLGPGFMHG
ncbi:hypothetical protein ACGFIF_24920 [Kribbella sp. NPDC049174]|uniref:hypothetical protein n=1 Tax=Kribbella sp. NPDC049174 TaxID=3364112 RepID=UPI003721D79B